MKREAARLMIMDGVSAPEVFKKLDVNPSLQYRWNREHLLDVPGFSFRVFVSNRTEEPEWP